MSETVSPGDFPPFVPGPGNAGVPGSLTDTSLNNAFSTKVDKSSLGATVPTLTEGLLAPSVIPPIPPSGITGFAAAAAAAAPVQSIGGLVGAVTAQQIAALVPSSQPAVIYASAFGVKANALSFKDAVMTAGSATLVSGGNTYVFQQSDVGKSVTVAGAGAGGAVLNSTITGVANGIATLAAAAGTTVAGQVATFGTDDTASYQAAVNAAAQIAILAGRCLIQMPAGISIVSGSITWQSRVSMRGVLNHSVVKWISTSDMTAGLFAGQAGSAANPYVDCHFEDFEIDCDAATQATYSVHGVAIWFQFCVRMIVRNMNIHGTPATAVGTDFMQHALVHGNVIINAGRLSGAGALGGSGIGIATGSALDELAVVSNNTIINPGQWGIFFEGQNSAPITSSKAVITGNYIETSSTWPSSTNYGGIGDCGLSACAITGNVINNTNAANSCSGISATNSNFSVSAPGSRGLIANNHVSGCHIGIHLNYTVAFSPSVCDYTIRGNKLTGNVGFGVAVTVGAGLNIDRVTIADNEIMECGLNGILLNMSGTGTMDHVLIKDNRIGNCCGSATANVQESGIAIGLIVTYLTIVGNIVFDNRATKLCQYGIYFTLAGTAGEWVYTNVYIAQNDLRDIGTPAAGAGGINTALGASVLSGWIIDNAGYNDLIGAVGGVTVGASPFTYTAGSTREVAYIFGGTVSTVQKNGHTLAQSSPCTVPLDPGQGVTITYSVLPTVSIDRL